jgi:hypothetical protein
LFSPYLIDVLMDRYGILPAQRWAYVVLMAAATMTALIRYRYMGETHPSGQWTRLDLISIVQETLGDLRETLGAVSRQIWVLILLGGLYQFAASLASVFMVMYEVEDVIHVTSSDWGLVTTASTVIVILSSIARARKTIK